MARTLKARTGVERCACLATAPARLVAVREAIFETRASLRKWRTLSDRGKWLHSAQRSSICSFFASFVSVPCFDTVSLSRAISRQQQLYSSSSIACAQVGSSFCGLCDRVAVMGTRGLRSARGRDLLGANTRASTRRVGACAAQALLCTVERDPQLNMRLQYDHGSLGRIMGNHARAWWPGARVRSQHDGARQKNRGLPRQRRRRKRSGAGWRHLRHAPSRDALRAAHEYVLAARALSAPPMTTLPTRQSSARASQTACAVVIRNQETATGLQGRSWMRCAKSSLLAQRAPRKGGQSKKRRRGWCTSQRLQAAQASLEQQQQQNAHNPHGRKSWTDKTKPRPHKSLHNTRLVNTVDPSSERSCVRARPLSTSCRTASSGQQLAKRRVALGRAS